MFRPRTQEFVPSASSAPWHSLTQEPAPIETPDHGHAREEHEALQLKIKLKKEERREQRRASVEAQESAAQLR